MATNQYGTKEEPGIVTDLTSSRGVPTSGDAPTDIGIVGQANLGDGVNEGSADTDTVYQVTRATTARNWFGHENDSLLTQAIIDMLNEGAYPIYAVAAPESTTSDDISGVSDNVITLENGPLREDASSITVTVDGTELNTNVTYEPVDTISPADGECYVNPVHAEVNIPSLPSDSDTSNDTVEYSYFDYPSGHDVMTENAGEVIDRFVPLSENKSVVDDANTTVDNMESEYELALLQAGADVHISDKAGFTPTYDDSRTQLLYPTRFEDGSSALAAYAAKTATLGLETTPINQRLSANKRLMEQLSSTDRGNLINNNVVPLADEAAGARIVDDPTTVTDSNTDEMNLQYGFNRLVADYIIETVRENEQPYIGRLHNPRVRRAFTGIVRSELSALQQSGMVLDYSLNVQPEGPTIASLEMNVDLAEPLRFIENTITIGQSASA